MPVEAGELPPSVSLVVRDLVGEVRTRPRLPPGQMRFSVRGTHRFHRHALESMLAYYERYGPIYTVRVFHRPFVVMLGPQANRFVTLTAADRLSWRAGLYGEMLIPLLGNGLITTDGERHDRGRRIVMPAFHHARMQDALAVMIEETERALGDLVEGERVDIYRWSRELAMRVAMRALLGLDPRGGHGERVARLFERALAFYDVELWWMLLRGPGTPWARLQGARRELDGFIGEEIARRRRSRLPGDDILGMLLDARDDDGRGLDDQQVRDQLLTLLFGAHDTTSSTLSFLLLELARHPAALAAVRREQERVLGGRAPSLEQLTGGLPVLTAAVSETLRLYPPVWFGPRRAEAELEFGGHVIPKGTHILHSAWASHRLSDVFPDPDRFDLSRFLPDVPPPPKGAYVPFGGGQRICVGKRFGQLLVKTAASVVLSGVELLDPHGGELKLATTPTLSPRGGLGLLVGERRPRATRAAR